MFRESMLGLEQRRMEKRALLWKNKRVRGFISETIVVWLEELRIIF